MITLNYDLLIEKTASACFAKEWKASPKRLSRLLWPISVPLIESRYLGVINGVHPETLRLIKLHGSIGWAYPGIDAGVGAQLYDLGVPDAQTWDAYTEGARDLVPVIVPPALSKTPWLANLTLRAIWRAAGLALQKATDVVVIGYSMPEADAQVRALLSVANPHKIRCVDPNDSAFEKCTLVWPDCPDVKRFKSVEHAVAEGQLL